MQGNSLDLLTLVALAVAVVVIVMLRNALGKRTGDEEARYEKRLRAAREAEQQAAAARDKVVTLPRRDRAEKPLQPDQQEVTARSEAETRVRTMSAGNPVLEGQLMQLVKLDPAFDPQHFLLGAKQAYEMIVMGFAEGNRKLLKDLLSRDVFEGFLSAINDREARGEQIDQSFVGISRAEIVEAEVQGNTANVAVKFVSQLISARRDRAGEVIDGDPQKIKEVTDIWTFAREVNSRNPNWRLVATQASN